MKRLPSTEQLVDIFSKHSFSFEAATTLQQLMDNSFTDHIERIRKKALSTFEFLTEEEFEQGIKRMEEASHKIDNSLPVYENIDLLVFRHI
ncbi:MAG: hypothetical protein JNL74_13305 [Fibrobacteres bacterium]|nr:hypothetical protein [Fibrobacterota bacterium]